MKQKGKLWFKKVKKSTSLVLRCCRSDMSSKNGFVWPGVGEIANSTQTGKTTTNAVTVCTAGSTVRATTEPATLLPILTLQNGWSSG